MLSLIIKVVKNVMPIVLEDSKFTIMWLIIFGIHHVILKAFYIYLKKPKDYIQEFSNIRNLTCISIHQRRINEDGTFFKPATHVSTGIMLNNLDGALDKLI